MARSARSVHVARRVRPFGLAKPHLRSGELDSLRPPDGQQPARDQEAISEGVVLTPPRIPRDPRGT